MTDPATGRNALAEETSPYLLQHADNPVHWRPWNAQALAFARELDRPILLSIGYSACHWCHVMAHESFESVEIAEVMNALFVNIKVDREERPDLDKIYQVSHQLLTRRSGGWPLTVFLDPQDQRPFFAGTYFPNPPRFGMPGFREVLIRIAEHFRDRRDEVREQNRSLVAALASIEPAPFAGVSIDAGPLTETRALLDQSYDGVDGGFGDAPKFPHPTNLDRLLRHYARSARGGSPDRAAVDMVAFTFEKMSGGGLYDQLGGGFCRYSVDAHWMIPHFEKMLYDNGPLLEIAVDLWKLTGSPRCERVARETAEWCLREMQSPQGGYYSTLDADSEGHEGKFYVWSPDEVRALLTDDEYAVFAPRFGLDRAPNFENTAWHLHVFETVDDAAERAGQTGSAARAHLDAARARLLGVRSGRIWPARDEKVLTAWNALMIRAMSVAGEALDEPRFVDSAIAALDFLRAQCWRDGRLLAVQKDGRARFEGYLDDYAFLLDAVLAVMGRRYRAPDLEFAVALAEVLLEHFEDREDGGFWFTADDHEALIHRTKPMMDDALPAGNGVAAVALARLGHLVGEQRYLEASERTLQAGWSGIERAPHAHNALLVALEEYLHPPETIVLRGPEHEMERWRRRALASYAPGRAVIAIPDDATDLPGLLGERRASAQRAVRAYVCEGRTCEIPLEDFEQFERRLVETETAPV